MSDELTVEINTKNLKTALRIFPEDLRHELADGLDHIGRHFFKTFWQTRLQGPPGIKAHPHGIFTHFYRGPLGTSDVFHPSAKRSATVGAINQSPVKTLDMGFVFYTDSKVAYLHEAGGRISKPGGGKLAVPLSARVEMFTSGGQLKKQYRQPRTIKNMVPIVLRGKTFLAKVGRKTKSPLPLFVLKNSIRIKPRLGFYQTWQDMGDYRINTINESVKKALNKTK